MVQRYSLRQELSPMNRDDELESKQPAENCEVHTGGEWIVNVHDVDIVSHEQRVQLIQRMTEIDEKGHN